MKNEIEHLLESPRDLEDYYGQLKTKEERGLFQEVINGLFESNPGNMLIDAWYFRLSGESNAKSQQERQINWLVAIPISIILGFVFFLLSDEPFMIKRYLPLLVLLLSPITAGAVLLYGWMTAKKALTLKFIVVGILAFATGYIFLVITGIDTQRYFQGYLDQMALHLPIISFAGVLIGLAGWRTSSLQRFAFLHKAIEVVVTGGLFAIAGGVFVGITVGLFTALSIDLPDGIFRLLIVGGAGLLPVLAVASVYDPEKNPEEQEFGQGIGQLVTILPRLLLPLTVLVLVIYIGFIPFNFMEPFKNRDVLIIFNGMQFAIMALLIGVTPFNYGDISDNLSKWLKRGILVTAIMASLVSVYTLAAFIYRTNLDGLSINRLIMMGWNIINIVIFVLVSIRLLRKDGNEWVLKMYRTISEGSVLYVGWSVIMLIVVPLVFR